MFTEQAFTLICLLTVGGIIFCSESDLTESAYESSSCGRERQLSCEIKKMHRRFHSLMRPVSDPPVFDVRHARTPSQFSTKRFEIRRQDEEKIHTLQESEYNPSQGELNKALLFAALYESGVMITALIWWGAQINVQDRQGRTPAMHACTYGNYEALQVLVDNDTDLTVKDHLKKTALIYTHPGQRALEIEAWSSLRLHETELILDPRLKCREIIEAHLKEIEAIQSDPVLGQNSVESSSVSCKCSCIVS